MKKLFVLVLALLALSVGQVSHAAWSAEWAHRAKLSLNTADDGLALKAAVDGAPVLIRLHTGNFSFVDAKPDGSDLRFIAADDKTPLKYHIEKFDGLNELALVWVQVPKLQPASKTDFIWLYYGNEKAPAGDDPKGSYDVAQALVYHFGEKDGAPKDSTANANHAARSSAKPGTSGLIGGGVTFDGSGEIAIATSPSLKAGGGATTLSMWIKPGEGTQAGTLYSQRDGADSLGLLLRGGMLVAQWGKTETTPVAVAGGTWQHVALVVKDGLALYLNGQEAARVSAPTRALGGEATLGRGFVGEMDELQIATAARAPEAIRLAALSQGQDQKLVGYGQGEGGDKEEGGTSHFAILLGALTTDGWVVVGILMVMMVISFGVMVMKSILVNATGRANERFKGQFQRLIDSIKPGGAVADTEADASVDAQAAVEHRESSLYRLYTAGRSELQQRFDSYAKAGREPLLTAQSIDAIRATIDATLVREMQRLNSKMVLLTIAIAGGPFLGLLGTVVGVMITFAAIAAAGDVNVNAIAPGIAAALIATVAGLAVAIPALFGYNYLTSRIKDLSSDMQVFVDEFITKIAENHSV
ncbi:DUF2341 domain-containing protein [Methylibium sp.]|uniref:DUF2341 domain-containing protein n=1 Tax=Methylibium sp. TaxID=2067992 RepID=UPI003D098AB2